MTYYCFKLRVQIIFSNLDVVIYAYRDIQHII